MVYLNAQVAWSGPLLLHQVFSTRYKVCEGVFLVQVLAILIPAAPHLTPAPHMGQGKDEAPVYEGKSVGSHVGVVANLVRPISAVSSLPWAVSTAMLG